MPLDSDQDTKPRTSFNYVGTRPIRHDGLEKVTGKAKFGADTFAPGMLHGMILRSPHAHAKIRSIDTSKAAALSGVKAIVTADDFTIEQEPGEMANVRANVMARGKVLYDGHAVAAVAAVSKSVAKKALKLITVDYEVLPHVTDVDAAMAEDAPLLHEDLITEGVDPPPAKASNVAARYEFGHGDVEAGFAKADIIVEREFKTAATHQGYIEPHAVLANLSSDGSGDMWVCTQGHFMVRDSVCALLGIDFSKLRVQSSEIGGGFGGKTTVFLEPVAAALSLKSGRPVKITMSREDVFRSTGPTASSSSWVKIGATKDGRIVAADGLFKYQGGAFPGSPVEFGAMAAFACYDLENVRAVGYDVVTNRPKQAAYRAPGAPMACYAVDSVVQEIADKLGIDSIDFRLMNAADAGTKSSYGPVFPAIGLKTTLEAAKAHPHYTAPLAEGQGRGVACGFWFNFGGQTSVSLNVSPDGSVNLTTGTPDIGGSRSSYCLMAAEELGIPYDQVRANIVDTATVGYNDVTDGSRVTFAGGLATINAARNAIKEMCKRAAMMWGIDADAVKWENGYAKPSGANAGDHEPLSLAQIAEDAANTGGPIAGHVECNADGAGVSFGTHICDVEVDKETGRTSIKRYTVLQDAGKAVHPSYVEGQYQGGAVQGIGWALNEEYIYNENGTLDNAGFLDYRIPVASDLPMIDTQILEIPNPGHPYGVRGVGETPIVPPLAAVSIAVSNAVGIQLNELPISPPKLLKALS